MAEERGAQEPASSEPDVDELREEIRASGSHTRADRDLTLLARPELRPVRLLLEYLKPELALQDLGSVHTIVVFGGTHLLDPEVARRRLEAVDPSDTGAVTRARTGVEYSRYYEIGREFGRVVGRCGKGPRDHRLVVVTGGGPGGMEGANRGAHEVGAASMGLNITLPQEQQPNPYLTPELSFQFRYFALRKLHFMLRARALVALPGGYGTFDELFETLCLIQTGKRAPLPVVLVGKSFWLRAVDFHFLLEQQMIEPADLELFEFAEDAQGIWECIQAWYSNRDRSVFGDGDPEGPEDSR